MNSRGWIDVSVPLQSGMVRWPGDPDVKIERTLSIDRGEPANQSAISMGAHIGTHIDAPLHFIKRGASIDTLPLSAVMGPCRVIGISNPEAIVVEELRGHHIRSGERLIFKTANSPRCWESEGFVEDYVYITPDAAKMLAARGVRTVGIDYLSVGGFRKGGIPTHVALMKAGIWIIEGLDLTRVHPGRYELLALPLKITGCDGAPARVLMKRTRG
jgi:arylformamidase